MIFIGTFIISYYGVINVVVSVKDVLNRGAHLTVPCFRESEIRMPTLISTEIISQK